MRWILFQWEWKGEERERREGEIYLHIGVEDRSCEDIARKDILKAGREPSSKATDPYQHCDLGFYLQTCVETKFLFFQTTQSVAFCYIHINSLRKCMWISSRQMYIVRSPHFVEVNRCIYVCKCTRTFMHLEAMGQP